MLKSRLHEGRGDSLIIATRRNIEVVESTRLTLNLRPQEKKRSFVTRLLVLACTTLPIAAAGQTFTVIYNFTGGNDGSNPMAGMTIDRAGNFYGTASEGGENGYGTVYKLSFRGGWVLTPLYEFGGGGGGSHPLARVVFGPDGSLYGTAVNDEVPASCSGGCGTVFKLQPPPHASGSIFTPWNATVIHRFQGTDGQYPTAGDLVFDSAGSVYGTTRYWGDLQCNAPTGCGTVYELARSNQGWTLTTLYAFHYALEGQIPMGGVVFDRAGKLYGTTSLSGMYGWGTVFQLAPGQQALSTIHAFTNGADGREPNAGLLIDGSGNLYGTTPAGGSGGAGTIFELTPSDGVWNFNLLYSVAGNEIGPETNLTMDSAGNLYGTTDLSGPYENGTVFKLSPSSDGWTYTLLHAFTGGADGSEPRGQLTVDANGNIYGTATFGGANSGCFSGGGCGVVFEITPH
jgi:uncharacterized repeat protein (TIGR03803 family)